MYMKKKFIPAPIADASIHDVEQAIARGAYTRQTLDKKLLAQLTHAAHSTNAKNATVNFRVNKHDLSRFKARANEQGIPYQTLLYSFIHTYTR